MIFILDLILIRLGLKKNPALSEDGVFRDCYNLFSQQGKIAYSHKIEGRINGSIITIIERPDPRIKQL